MELLEDQPRGKQDYDVWISDGVALGKGIFSEMQWPSQQLKLPLKMIVNRVMKKE